MSKIVTALFKLIPESALKNHFRCFIYNKKQAGFTIAFKKSRFVVKLNGIEMFFAENPYHNLIENYDYLIERQILKGDTVIDAGAFIGVFAVYASKVVGDEGKVFAFEPDPNTFKRLNTSLELNGVRNVQVANKGLWSSETTLTFRGGLELGSSFLKNESVGTGTRVAVTTIDNALSGEQISGNIFFKMNIEGSEVEALKGATTTIEKYRPYFTIRDHEVNGEFTDKGVETFLKSYGYSVKTIVEGMAEMTTFASVEEKN